jgi:hypothetical protein
MRINCLRFVMTTGAFVAPGVACWYYINKRHVQGASNEQVLKSVRYRNLTLLYLHVIRRLNVGTLVQFLRNKSNISEFLFDCAFLRGIDSIFAHIFSMSVLRIKVRPTGGRQLNYEKYFVPSAVPLVLPQAHPSRLVIPKCYFKLHDSNNFSEDLQLRSNK